MVNALTVGSMNVNRSKGIKPSSDTRLCACGILSRRNDWYRNRVYEIFFPCRRRLVPGLAGHAVLVEGQVC